MEKENVGTPLGVENKLSIVKNGILSYFENTSIHGLAYLPTSFTNRFEKLFWSLVSYDSFISTFKAIPKDSILYLFNCQVILTGLCCGLYQVNEAFFQWKVNPIKISPSTYNYEIENVQVIIISS